MQITKAQWNNYIKKLSALSTEAGNKMQAFIKTYGLSDQDALLRYAMGLVQKYGEGSAALACQMYDEIAALSGADVPLAEPAEVASQHEVAKGVMGSLKQSPSGQLVGGVVNRFVKQAGADTTLKNAKRDRCEFAWIPSGDTCAFCFTLASAGWRKAGPKTISGDHAEHIHPHCDCQYCIRFDSEMSIEGYDPDSMREKWDSLEGDNSKEKLNTLRREMYAAEKEQAPDFYTGANGKTLRAAYKEYIGDNKMQDYLARCNSDDAKRVIRADFRKTSFIGDGDTASIRKFELETGLKCGRNGGDHAQKAQDLIRQIERTLLKDIPESDKLMLEERLERLREVSKNEI